jgi:hypothetical protein
MSFTPRRPPETPPPITPVFDTPVVFALEEILDECLGHLSLNDYLFALVRGSDLAESLERKRCLGRAVDYVYGRIEWQLGLSNRRPPRGWREGLGTRTLGERVYLGLDALAYQALNSWAGIVWAIDPTLEPKQLTDSHYEDRFRAAIESQRKQLRVTTRERLSPLAAGAVA